MTGATLDALVASIDLDRRLARDPVRFPRRYADPRDREIAALIAASLAYGRVDLFGPVLDQLGALLDAHGGPRAAIDRFSVRRDGPAFAPLVYRWNRGGDFVILFAALRELLGSGTLAERFVVRDGEADIAPALTRFVATLRDAATAMPRGVRMLLPSPEDGSACKRWNMMLRWLVRPDDGVDLGVWSHVSPRALVVPLDTHVGRIARFVGLTERTDGSWRTAREVTDALARLCPEDPVRYDFALAHLGISGGCKGRWDRVVCPPCPLVALCIEATGRSTG